MRRFRLRQWPSSSLGALSLLSVVAVGAMPMPSYGQGPGTRQPLTSAAIDPSIFRDGEVRRFSETHGAWTVVCDEIARLKQRFCSLRSPILRGDGQTAALLTISTGQDGRPAALLRIAADLVAAGHVEISPVAELAISTPSGGPAPPSAKQKSKPPAVVRIKPVSCDKGVCTVIWTLNGDQIGALNSPRGLRLMATPAAELSSLATLAPTKPKVAKTTELLVAARGFTDAVGTSMRPFEP
jgi:invasion protein IalB